MAWICDIHGEEFDDPADGGACPFCYEEWHPVTEEDKEEDDQTPTD